MHARFDFTIAIDADVPFEIMADTIQDVGVAEILLTGDIDFERLATYRFQVENYYSSNFDLRLLLSVGFCH